MDDLVVEIEPSATILRKTGGLDFFYSVQNVSPSAMFIVVGRFRVFRDAEAEIRVRVGESPRASELEHFYAYVPPEVHELSPGEVVHRRCSTEVPTAREKLNLAGWNVERDEMPLPAVCRIVLEQAYSRDPLQLGPEATPEEVVAWQRLSGSRPVKVEVS